ncbi:hypothetical protein FRC17_005314, partial [Serendipita sp. 399]
AERTEIVTIEEPSKKAAAEGAAIWFSKQLVRGRAARYTFGINAGVLFDEAKHREHHARSYIDAAYVFDRFALFVLCRVFMIVLSGVKRLSIFDPLIAKGSVLSDDWEKVTNHHRSYISLPAELGSFTSTIYAWSGQGEANWVQTLQDNDKLVPGMRIFCKLKADFSPLRPSLKMQTGSNNGTFWRIDYQIVLSFKRSVLQARLRWFEDVGDPVIYVVQESDIDYLFRVSNEK